MHVIFLPQTFFKLWLFLVIASLPGLALKNIGKIFQKCTRNIGKNIQKISKNTGKY